jgi:hypothetical protein
MNLSIRIATITALIAVFSLAQAHDPAEHAKEAAEAGQGADCSAMDHSTMDPNDPVAQALMAKCGMHHDAEGGHDGHAPAATKPPKPADSHGDH